MADAFDPYYEWLGIPRKDQPPNHYRLLGIEVFEANLNVIERAADRQMSHVRTFQVGKHGKQSQELLNVLSSAKLCLLHPEKKQAYDDQLRGKLAADESSADDLTEDALPPVAAASLTSDDDAGGKKTPSDEVAFDFRPAEPERHSASSRIRQTSKPVGKPLLKWGGAGALAIVLIVVLLAILTSGNSSDPQETEGVAEETGNSSAGDPDADVEQDAPPVRPGPRTKRFLAVDESLHVPTDPASAGPWPQASREVLQRIERALGILDDDFAICQTMLLDQFIQTARDLRPCGYRPIRVRPYLETGAIHVAAAWSRDGLPWRLAVAPNAESVLKSDERLRIERYHAVDVAGVREEADRFVAVWAKISGQQRVTQIEVGVALRDLQTRSQALKAQQFVPVTRQAFVATGGDVQTSSVWSKFDPPPPWDQIIGSANDFTRALKPGHFPLDLSLRPSLAGSGEFLCTYLSASERSFKQSTGLSPRDHREQCRGFAALGYRPAAIGVADVGGGSALVAVSVWHMPDRTAAEQVTERPAPNAPEPPDVVAAKQSHALRFAGRDRVRLRDTLGLADLNRDFTAEAWIRLSTQSPLPSHYLMGNGAMRRFHPELSDTEQAGWFLILQTISADPAAAGMMILRMGKQSGTDVRNGPTPPLRTGWHHVAICNEAVADQSFRFTLFCDGQQVLQQNRSGEQVFPSPEEFFLGASERSAPAVNFHGDVKAFRLSSRARYEGTFEPPAVFMTDAEVLALLDFAGTESGRIRDLSGYDRHGEISGPVWVDLDKEPEPTVAAAEPRKPPLPDNAALRAAARQARDGYRAELLTAKQPGAIAELASQLLVKAGENTDPSTQLALLLLSREMAVQALDVQHAIRTVDALAAHYEFDSWAAKAKVINSLLGTARENPDLRAISAQVLDLYGEALDAEAFEAATEILDTIRTAARRLNDNGLKSLTNRLGNQLGYDVRALQQAEAARSVLSTSPADTAANLAVGKYLCFSRDDWEHGLVHLGVGTDGLAELAQRDRQAPEQPELRLQLARDWHSWADSKNRGLDQNGGWIRARYWYQSALLNLTGPDKARVEETLDVLSGKVLSRDVIGTRLSFLDFEVGEVKQLRGHTSAATCIAVSRSGRILVSGSTDDTVRVWDLMKGESIGTIRAEVGDVAGVVLASDDEFVIVIGRQGSVETWNAQAGIKSASTKLGSPVRRMAMAVDGSMLLWARPGATDNLRLKILGRPESGPSLTCPTEPTAIAMSNSGRLAAAADAKNMVHAWNLASQQPLGPFTGLTERITHVAVSPNERLLAASTTNEVIVWDVSTGRQLKRLREQNETYARIMFSRDCRQLVTSGRTNQLSVWDVESGTRAQRVSGGGDPNAGVLAIAFLPDDRGVVTAGNDGLIRVWRIE